MGNCLVTKLAASVSNDNLDKITDVVVHLLSNTQTSDAGKTVSFTAKEDTTVKIKGTAIFEVNGESVGNTLSLTANVEKTAIIRSSDDNSRLVIEHPELIEVINFGYLYCTVDDLNLYKLTSIDGIISYSSFFTPDVKSFSDKPFMTTVLIAYAKGDVASVVNSPNLNELRGNNMTGDIALVEDSIEIVYSAGTFLYSTRDISKHRVSVMNGANLGSYVDAYLINSAALTIGPIVSLQKTWAKAINIKGNRTSASDAAVASLKSEGYTIKVNDETL